MAKTLNGNSTIMVSVICFWFVFVSFEFYKGNRTSMQHRLLFFQLMGQMHLFQCRLYNFVRRSFLFFFLKQLDVICPVSRVNTAVTTASLSGMCAWFRGYVDTICQDQTQISHLLALSFSLSHAFMFFRCLDCCFVVNISGISL